MDRFVYAVVILLMIVLIVMIGAIAMDLIPQ
jgi:hypothetical protein